MFFHLFFLNVNAFTVNIQGTLCECVECIYFLQGIDLVKAYLCFSIENQRTKEPKQKQ